MDLSLINSTLHFISYFVGGVSLYLGMSNLLLYENEQVAAVQANAIRACGFFLLAGIMLK